MRAVTLRSAIEIERFFTALFSPYQKLRFCTSALIFDESKETSEPDAMIDAFFTSLAVESEVVVDKVIALRRDNFDLQRGRSRLIKQKLAIAILYHFIFLRS